MSLRPDDGGPGSGLPLDIYPHDLNSVGLAFADGQSRLDTIGSTLTNALQYAAGMAGDDSYGRNFAATYDPAAKALFHALSAAVRAIGSASTALVTTANNYLKADHHSNPKAGSTPPEQFPLPAVYSDVTYPDPDPAIGPGHSSVPHALAKYWPNGHQDQLRDAATAFRTASTALDTLGTSLHGQVTSLTDNNSDDSLTAMAGFWTKIWQDAPDGGQAPLSTAKYACDQLAKACDSFAQAIDNAHSTTEHKLSEAGIAIGFTTAIGVALTVFTFGGSDAAAGALDAGEAAAILGEVEVTLDEAVTTISTDMIADIETSLQAAADAVPEIETVDAETTQVSQELERELAETEARTPARTGGRGGGGGGDEPPKTGGNEEPGEPDPDDDPNLDRLRPAERDTLARARGEYPDLNLKASAEERDGEYMDSQGRTYDQMGNPVTSQFWDRPGAPQRFYNAIQEHLNKSIDFTVVDLTGFSEQSATDIRTYIESLSPAQQAKIIRIGF
ncbi:hypothetical protein [Streptomyces sp. HPF1205]|uniref:WXG100-like domain-containing protein n=1 Tax=Streptomyces sp. HPF1205 TaxID=2873262 RepID=UPI001CECBD5B|nr:hypothetical protein [Streptomyces sp. HPF1205]